MELPGEDVTKLVNAIERLNDSVKKLDQMQGSSNSYATINANGLIVSVACVILLLVGFAEMTRRYDRTQDYLNAIYMQAPHLKPKEESK